MNDDLQNADGQMGGTICAFCKGEGEYLVHLALDSAENIYEACPICKGEEVRTMNDLQNALEQLKCRASDGWEPLHLLPKEAQALLDERDTLRKALGMIAEAYTTDKFARRCACAALAKTRNEET